MLKEPKKSREGELKEAGWVKQFATCEPRLSEFVELYESLGFEVYLEPATLQDLGATAECNVCYVAELDKYKTIYIRPMALDQFLAEEDLEANARRHHGR